jgi:hypothetical protein
MRFSNSFTISIITILACLASGYFKLGVEAVIASISATYVIGRGAQKVGLGVALAKDPNSNVSDNVDKLNG